MNVLIGYINSFKYAHPVMKDILGGQPKEGSVYRILYEPTEEDDSRAYQLYLGKNTNRAGMDTIFLGPDLVGTYQDKWSFDIAVITKENYLDFTFKKTELKKLKEWLETDNADIKNMLEKNPMAHDMHNIPSTVSTSADITMKDQTVAKAVAKVMDFEERVDKALSDMSGALTLIVDKDIRIALAISELLVYIASTYKDKYEDSGRANFARDFIISSESTDAAVFNTLKYLQRYCTTGFEKSGKVVDVHKAIHYLLFELQRQHKANDKK